MCLQHTVTHYNALQHTCNGPVASCNISHEPSSKDDWWLIGWRTECANSFEAPCWHPLFMWLIHMWHDSLICDMTHSYVTWLIYRWHDWFMWHDSFICDMTHSYLTWLVCVWHGSFTWLIHMWRDPSVRDMTQLIHPTHLCVTWLFHMTYSYVTWLICSSHDTTNSHNSFMRRHDWFMCDMTHSYVAAPLTYVTWLIYV